MNPKERKGSGTQRPPQGRQKLGKVIENAVHAAIQRGYVIGREVLIGRIPGIVVGYNIASFGRFVGTTYPLVVRTAMGVTKCSMDELSLA